MRNTLPIILDRNREATFPAFGSTSFEKFPQVKIDHVQTSNHIRSNSRVMKYVGSDHKAIELTLD
jgi:hypothetical protein